MDEQLSEAAILVHLHHDVEPADELSFDVHLGNGWPIRILLDRRSERLIGQHVNILVRLDSIGVQEGDSGAAEATLWHLARSLHEQADVVLADPFRDVLRHFIGCLSLRLWLEVVVAVLVGATSAIVRAEPSESLLLLGHWKEESGRLCRCRVARRACNGSSESNRWRCTLEEKGRTLNQHFTLLFFR